jgi:hypothetical protein
MGQSRQFRDVRDRSALPSIAAALLPCRERPSRATCGLMQCSKQHLYSITSASSIGGIVRPNAFARF